MCKLCQILKKLFARIDKEVVDSDAKLSALREMSIDNEEIDNDQIDIDQQSRTTNIESTGSTNQKVAVIHVDPKNAYKQDEVSRWPGHIVVVVSPLLSLMDDQVAHLTSLGVSAVNISSRMEEDCDGVEAGEYSIVYGMPEAWILNPRWRNMLNSKVYSTRLCALAVDEAHVMRQS
ncbi:ATP-dependent DNA helicase Q1, partial [Paramuricea clavata]